MKRVVFSFGRFQPPTVGHEMVVNQMTRIAESLGASVVVFPSRTMDGRKNPLSVDQRLTYCRRWFPLVHFVDDMGVRSPIDAFRWLDDMGAKEVWMVAGSDRVAKYRDIVERNKTRFDVCELVEAGIRDPDEEGIAGVSASKMRGYVKAGDYASFRNGLPSAATERDALTLYRELEGVLNEDVDVFKALLP